MNKRMFWMEIHRHWKSEPRYKCYNIYVPKCDVPKVLHLCKQYGIESSVCDCIDESIITVML